MKKYVFIGAFDKTDMLIYVAKILTLMGKKVLLVDTTILKKSRYIVPSMVNEKQYITNYEGIDVAIGFGSFEDIKKYQMQLFGEEEKYDIALLDIDRAIAYQKFNVSGKDRHFFVTSFDVYNLKRGIQVLAYIKKDAKVKKIYFTKNMLQEEDDYLNYLTKDYHINWEKGDIIFFPFETEDQDAIFINQRSGGIKMRGLSRGYKDAISFLVEGITNERSGKVKKHMKTLES